MKNILPRFIPSGYVEYRPTLAGYNPNLFQCFVSKEKSSAIFYVGKQKKHAWFYSFRDNEEMKKKINESISRLMEHEDLKEKRKIEKKAQAINVEIGQIYCYSWGYDQTNVDFYQVTEKKSKSFVIQEIASRQMNEPGPSGSMSAYIKPVRDAFTKDSKPMVKHSLLMDFGCLSLTDENEKHLCSWYA